MSREPTVPGVVRMLDWAEGRLAPADAELVAAQMAHADAEARKLLEWFRDFRSVARALPLVQPPPTLRVALRQDFARWAAARASAEDRRAACGA